MLEPKDFVVFVEKRVSCGLRVLESYFWNLQTGKLEKRIPRRNNLEKIFRSEKWVLKAIVTVIFSSFLFGLGVPLSATKGQLDDFHEWKPGELKKLLSRSFPRKFFLFEVSLGDPVCAAVSQINLGAAWKFLEDKTADGSGKVLTANSLLGGAKLCHRFYMQ